MKKMLLIISLIISISVFCVPKNIVIVIGDGMGFNHLYLSELLAKNNNVEVVTTKFPVTGIVSNNPADNLVTDSAAAATAFFCGQRTNIRNLGLDVKNQPIENIAFKLKKMGMHTGVITNTRYYDATPGGLYAHANREDTSKITEDLLVADHIDYFVAGGLEKLGVNPFTGRPTRSSNLKVFKEKGYDVYGINYKKIFDVNSNSDKFRAFVGMGDLNFENEKLNNEITFSETVKKSLDLIQHKENLFLMIECGRIDDACHINNIEAVKSELLEFQKVMNIVLNTFDKEETLFLVFADHETGGLSIKTGDKDGENLTFGWTHTDHTATYIPMLAMGEGQENFSGFYHFEELPKKLFDILEEKK